MRLNKYINACNEFELFEMSACIDIIVMMSDKDTVSCCYYINP